MKHAAIIYSPGPYYNITWKAILQCHVHLFKMAAEYHGVESVHSGRADLRQKLESNFLLDAFLPVLYLENVLTDYEFKQLFPIPQPALVDRNRKFLDYLANKDPTTVSDTLSILFRPEYEPYGYFGEMLQQLFDVDRKREEGMRRKTSRKPQQGGERGSGAKEVSALQSSHLTSTGVVCNGLFVDGIVWNALELQS